MVPRAGLDVWGGLSGEAEVGELGGQWSIWGSVHGVPQALTCCMHGFGGTDSSGGIRVRVPNPRCSLGLSSRSATSHH